MKVEFMASSANVIQYLTTLQKHDANAKWVDEDWGGRIHMEVGSLEELAEIISQLALVENSARFRPDAVIVKKIKIVDGTEVLPIEIFDDYIGM